MSSTQFIDDVKWDRGDHRVQFSLSAYDRKSIWLMSVELPPREQRMYMVKFGKDETGAWVPSSDANGLEAYDVSGGPWPRLDKVPVVIENTMAEIQQKIADNEEMLLGIATLRERARIVERINECSRTIVAAQEWIAKRTAKLEEQVRAIDPNARLIHITPSETPFKVRESIDTELGPLVLEIQSGDRFSLATPASMAGREAPLRNAAVWNHGKWLGLTGTPSVDEAIERIGEKVRTERARDIIHAAWGAFAVARHDLMVEEHAVDILEHETLPSLVMELEGFNAEEAIAAPRP